MTIAEVTLIEAADLTHLGVFDPPVCEQCDAPFAVGDAVFRTLIGMSGDGDPIVGDGRCVHCRAKELAA